MTVFTYKALGSGGETNSGTLTAESRAAAMADLATRGLHPIEVKEDSGGAERRAVAVGRPGRVSQRSVEAFTRQLSNLLAGGVPLARALALLRKEASNPAAKYLWGEVHDDVVGGMPLADAMAKWPSTFTSVYVAMVRAGEAGGFLDVVLAQIADFRTREADLKGKVKAAMVYPMVLGGLAVVVLTFLMVFFIPKFKAMFADSKASLPMLTQIIVAVSDSVASVYGFVILGVVVTAAIIIKRAMGTPSGRRRYERMVLSTPLLGTVVAHFALVRFTRMLGTLVGAGVPLILSLRTSKEAIGNQTLGDTVNHAIEEVQHGTSLSLSLATSPRLFPPPVIEMVAVAEETGKLDRELLRLSATYESELDRQLRTLVSLTEPLMLIIMAFLIGTVVLGMLLPIFNMQDLVK